MADWKQITARIRRARTGKDPTGQLSNLYQKTRDAMVAFELARHLDVSGQSSEAAKWYSTAAERFRRSDWKLKAQEAAARLGSQTSADQGAGEVSPPLPAPLLSVTAPDPTQPFVQTAEAFESLTTTTVPETAATPVAATTRGTTGRRRRGRRGGRDRGKVRPASQAAPAAAPQIAGSAVPPAEAVDESSQTRLDRDRESTIRPRTPAESVGDSATVRGRYGDPGVSSRLSALEMQFRRLLSCAPLKLDQADRAPAGPGVLLLSDSELTTHYQVEACQTLRIAIANLSRGGSSRRGAESIKPQLAKHLGIAESRVSKYLADHCVVRYLQLDDDASNFAHFVIAVLRPVLNQ